MGHATLLEEALAAQDTTSHNNLLIDVNFLQNPSQPSDFVEVVELAVRWNRQLEEERYPWWNRPIFEVIAKEGDRNEKRMHLRCNLRYGTMKECWRMVGFLLRETAENYKIAVQFWDTGGGDLLLTEAAYHLPDWMHTQSEDEVEYSRNRCFVYNSKIVLVPSLPQHLAVSQALDEVVHNRFETVSPMFLRMILGKTTLSGDSEKARHRAALVVPRSVANLLSKLPHIGDAAAAAFVKDALAQKPSFSTKYVDWVWTTHSFGRVQYAALRNAVSRSWPDADAVPFRSPELQRLQRQASKELTPHLKDGVAVGVRLVAGIQCLLSSSALPPEEASSSYIERWSALLAQMGNDPSWFLEAYQAGPNHTTINLGAFVTLEEQCENVKTKPSQLRSLLKKGDEAEGWDGVPKQTDVDEDESWMTISDKQMNTELDRQIVEDRVETFIQEKSDVEGIETKQNSGIVNPTVFLNLLQATLKAKTPEDMSFLETLPDPYFSQNDYEMSGSEDDDGIYDDENIDHEDKIQIQDMMQMMDDELQRNDEIDIASAWMQSLDAGDNENGPVQRLLQEIKLPPPRP